MNALTQPQRFLQAAQGLDATAFVSTPDYVSQYTQLPEHWEYDINPGSGNSRATYLGELFYGGQAASNRVATQGDIAAATTGVSSWNTRTGAVVLTLADVTGVGGAPINNTALTGNPTCVTQPQGTSNTTLASTAFVTQALANQPGVYSWNGRQGAVTLTLSDVTGAGGAPIQSPMFLGTPQAVTAPPGTDNQQLATTAFVMTQMGNSVVSWNGRVGNVTMTLSDVTSVGGAPINAPAFTGVATAVTATPGTATQQLATCQFVTNAVQAATVGVASFNTRTGAVTLQAADISGAGGALLAGPALTGVPTCPTAPANTNTTQIASCAFVETAITGAAVVSSFNTRTGAVTLSSADVANAGALMTTGGTLSGPLVLQGNASAALNPVPFQQLTSAINAIAIPQASTTAPIMDGTAAVGTGTTFARADHVHPSDTSRFPITGGTITGNLTVGGNLAVSGTSTTFSSLPNFYAANSGGNPVLAFASGVSVSSSGGNLSFGVGAGEYIFYNTSNPTVQFSNGIWVGTPGVRYGGTTNYVAFIWSASTLVLYIDNTSIGTVQVAASDVTLKENIKPATENALHTLGQISLHEYDLPNRVDRTVPPMHHNMGFSAQELDVLIPEAVTRAPPDPDGKPGILSLDLMPILARCVGAIQQLTARVAALEART